MIRLSIAAILLLLATRAAAQSKEQAFSRDSVALLAELRHLLETDQQYRKNHTLYQEHYEAARQADSASTLRMIAIIREYGFPSRQRFRLKKKDGLMPHILLVHAPQAYFDTLRPLLAAEQAAGRMTEFEYGHIIWHLNGRQGVPVLSEHQKVRKKGNQYMIKG